MSIAQEQAALLLSEIAETTHHCSSLVGDGAWFRRVGAYL